MRNINKYEKRICEICKKPFYTKKNRQSGLRPCGLRKITSKTCSKKCSKIYEDNYRNKYFYELKYKKLRKNETM